MRHEMNTNSSQRGASLASHLVRTTVIGTIAVVVGAQLFSLPVSSAAAKGKGKISGGFGGHAGGNIPAYCYSGSNLFLAITNAPTGTLPPSAPYAQFASAISLGTSTGSDTFQLTPGSNFQLTVTYIDQFGNLVVKQLSGSTFTPPAALRNGLTTFTVTGTYTCSDGTTRTSSKTFVAL